jgi:hypothetical protein
LLTFEDKDPQVIAISGQPNVNANSPLVKSIGRIVAGLKDP